MTETHDDPSVSIGLIERLMSAFRGTEGRGTVENNDASRGTMGSNPAVPEKSLDAGQTEKEETPKEPSPFPPKDEQGTITFEMLEKMRPEEINKNWDEVSQVINQHIATHGG